MRISVGRRIYELRSTERIATWRFGRNADSAAVRSVAIERRDPNAPSYPRPTTRRA
jgi:hypothetical protein